MGDAQHLTLLAQGAQLLPDDVGHGAADTRVDFVEDHGRHRIQAQRGDFDRQRDTRQLTARSHFAQGTRRLAGVGGNQELDPLGPVRVRFDHRLWLDIDQELTAAHAQLADQGGGGVRQRLGGFPAAGAEHLGHGLPLAGGTVDLAGQGLQALVGTAQLLHFGLHGVAVLAQPFHRHAVLAREVMQAAQAAFDVLELLRVGIQVVMDAVEQGQRFVQLDGGAVEQGIDVPEPAVVFGHAGQVMACLLQQLQDRDLVVAIEAADRHVAGADQRAGMGLAAVAAAQGGDRGRVQILALELAELVFQVADPVAHVALARERLGFIDQRLPACRGLADLRALGVVAGEGVQQRELRGAREQGLLFVLAVDLHQHAGQLGQLGQRHRAAVDEGARAAVGADHPSQLALFFVVQLVVAQPLTGRGVGQRREFGRELGACGAVADHAAVGAQPGQKAQRVHHQRLARAGFT